MSLKVSIPKPENRDFGRRLYLSGKDYVTQMRQTTDRAKLNEQEYPLSEFKKPYATDSYEEMEYQYSPTGGMGLDFYLPRRGINVTEDTDTRSYAAPLRWRIEPPDEAEISKTYRIEVNTGLNETVAITSGNVTKYQKTYRAPVFSLFKASADAAGVDLKVLVKVNTSHDPNILVRYQYRWYKWNDAVLASLYQRGLIIPEATMQAKLIVKGDKEDFGPEIYLKTSTIPGEYEYHKLSDLIAGTPKIYTTFYSEGSFLVSDPSNYTVDVVYEDDYGYPVRTDVLTQEVKYKGGLLETCVQVQKRIPPKDGYFATVVSEVTGRLAVRSIYPSWRRYGGSMDYLGYTFDYSWYGDYRVGSNGLLELYQYTQSNGNTRHYYKFLAPSSAAKGTYEVRVEDGKTRLRKKVEVKSAPDIGMIVVDDDLEQTIEYNFDDDVYTYLLNGSDLMEFHCKDEDNYIGIKRKFNNSISPQVFNSYLCQGKEKGEIFEFEISRESFVGVVLGRGIEEEV
jgi:hypothetical protein